MRNDTSFILPKVSEGGGGGTGQFTLIGSSSEFKRVIKEVEKLKGTDLNVVLRGESGTGKELFANLLNFQENDPQRPLISVNCAAIPQNLMESTLFGHEKGSFTGAIERREGKFELAHNGDIFLDEISALRCETQAKLLRILQDKEVERVGSNLKRKLHFRVISASNEKLEELIERGLFRSDLYYRLNCVEIIIPPLRERGEDIIKLAEFFLANFCKGAGKSFSKEVKEVFLGYEWRGNVRELKSTVERMATFADGKIIGFRDLPPKIRGFVSINRIHRAFGVQDGKDLSVEGNLRERIENCERKILIQAFERNGWNRTKTSLDLGISRAKLYRRLSRLNILNNGGGDHKEQKLN